jgi:pyridoxamine 5'-phosphate oxidase-like protein
MGSTYPSIDGELAAFLSAQHVFFVATAPLDAEGHVNLSPKGHDTFRVVDPYTVAYLDLTGSGIETVAHLHENGRIVFCFCAFAGPPRIVRLHGRGEVLEPSAADFAKLRPLFPEFDGVRSIIRVEVRRIADSCGYAVPLMRYEGERRQLIAWTEKKGPPGIAGYQATKNRRSLDGLPGLKSRGE